MPLPLPLPSWFRKLPNNPYIQRGIFVTHFRPKGMQENTSRQFKTEDMRTFYLIGQESHLCFDWLKHFIGKSSSGCTKLPSLSQLKPQFCGRMRRPPPPPLDKMIVWYRLEFSRLGSERQKCPRRSNPSSESDTFFSVYYFSDPRSHSLHERFNSTVRKKMATVHFTTTNTYMI